MTRHWRQPIHLRNKFVTFVFASDSPDLVSRPRINPVIPTGTSCPSSSVDLPNSSHRQSDALANKSETGPATAVWDYELIRRLVSPTIVDKINYSDEEDLGSLGWFGTTTHTSRPEATRLFTPASWVSSKENLDSSAEFSVSGVPNCPRTIRYNASLKLLDSIPKIGKRFNSHILWLLEIGLNLFVIFRLF
jgi:hypothetical protein